MSVTFVHVISALAAVLGGVVTSLLANVMKDYISKHTRRNIELRIDGKVTQISLPPDAKDSDIAEAVRKAFPDSTEAQH
jgi:hypothetical protein